MNKFNQEVLQHLPKYWLTLRCEICQIPKLQEEILIKLIHTLDFLFKQMRDVESGTFKPILSF